MPPEAGKDALGKMVAEGWALENIIERIILLNTWNNNQDEFESYGYI